MSLCFLVYCSYFVLLLSVWVLFMFSYVSFSTCSCNMKHLHHIHCFFLLLCRPLRRSSGRFTSVSLSWSWSTNSTAVWPGRTEPTPPASWKSWSTRGTRGGTACRRGWLPSSADSRWAGFSSSTKPAEPQSESKHQRVSDLPELIRAGSSRSAR